MTTRMERERQELRDALKLRADYKRSRIASLGHDGRNHAVMDSNSPATLSQIRSLLIELHMMMSKESSDRPVRFVVTERDASGNIKAFKVVRT